MKAFSLLVSLIVSATTCFSQQLTNQDSLLMLIDDANRTPQQIAFDACTLSDLLNQNFEESDKNLHVYRTLIRLGNKMQIDSLLKKGYVGLYQTFNALNEFDSVFFYTTKALPFLKNDNNLLGDLHTKLGMYRYMSSDENGAIAENKIALNYRLKEKKDTNGIFTNVLNISIIYSGHSEHDSAIHYLNFAHQYARESGDPKLIFRINMQMGTFYYYAYSPEKALIYLNQALANTEGISSNKDLSDLYGAFGDNYGLMDEYDKAISNYHLSKKYAILDADIRDEHYSNLRLGQFYLAENKFDSAGYFLTLADNYALNNNDAAIRSLTAEALSGYYVTVGQYPKAITYGLISVQNADSKIDSSNAYNTLHLAYKGLQDYKNSYEFYVKYKQLTDSIFNKDSYQKMVELEEEQKFILKEQKIESEKVLAEKESEKNRLISIGAMGFAILLMFIMVIIYKALKKTKQQKAIIENANLQKGLLLKEIHHRVKNNLQLVKSLLNLQSKQLTDETLKGVFEESKARIEAMALLHKKLYQNEDLSIINFNTYISELIEIFGKLDGNYARVKIVTDIPNTWLDIDTAVPLGLMVSELITNSFKYAFVDNEHPELNITLIQNSDGSFTLIHSDNGPGLPADFNWKQTTSLGLRLIKSLSKQLLGTINYEYRNGFSTFSVIFKDLTTRKKQD